MKSTLVICLLGLSFLLSVNPTKTSQRSCSSGRNHKSGKGCGERLNRFLKDVLQAREDLSWIDQLAHQIRSTESFHVNQDLEEKLNGMFFNIESRVWTPEINDNTHQRYKRDSKQTKTSSTKRNPTHSKRILANEKNSNSPKHKSDWLHQQNFNSTMKSAQKIRRTKNEIATTAKPLEKILKSINVFPMEDNRDTRDVQAALKFNDDIAENYFQSRLFKHETTRRRFTRASSNEVFRQNYLKFGRSLKSMISEADVVESDVVKSSGSEYETDRIESKRAMNGDLARDIVDAIFSELKAKGGFDAPIFVSQYYTQPKNSMIVGSSKREAIDFPSAKENGNMTKQLMVIVQQLISEEVDKKSCTSLQSELQSFLEWLIDANIDNYGNFLLLEEKTNAIITEVSSKNSITNLEEWYRKAQSLKNLLNEYDELSRTEKNKVQAIYEYLNSRFQFAEAYIEALESHELPMDQLAKIHIV